ncbi:MAG: hypothetical protein JW932_13785 [Deltaproteobacteria bacterium]|nr:hypothetical protein [Deltaproteobacteria bacterium]
MIKKKIGLKYCGGCNPSYDRVAAVNEIQDKLRHIEFVPWDTEGCDTILIVMGCESACVDLDPFTDKNLLLLKTPRDIPLVVQQLIKI